MRQIEKLDYRIVRPRATHTKAASCEDADCQAYRGGWVSAIDEASELGQRQAHYIRTRSGRGFTEESGADGLTRFAFAPGQACFGEHRVDVEREPFFVRHSTNRTTLRHRSAADWRDDHATEVDRLRTFQERHG